MWLNFEINSWNCLFLRRTRWSRRRRKRSTRRSTRRRTRNLAKLTWLEAQFSFLFKSKSSLLDVILLLCEITAWRKHSSLIGLLQRWPEDRNKPVSAGRLKIFGFTYPNGRIMTFIALTSPTNTNQISLLSKQALKLCSAAATELVNLKLSY